MTDAEFEQLEARIQAIADEWIECLGLRWWHISFFYHRDSGEYRASSPEDMPLSSKGYTAASWAYCDAAVHLNMPGLAEYDATHLEEVVVHELMHIMVHEMRSVTNCACDQFDIRHEERVCTTLQRAFMRTKEHFMPIEAAEASEETVPDAG